MVFGINGHPLTQHEYKDNWTDQLKTIRNLGLQYYRIDVPLNQDGLPDKRFDKLTALFAGDTSKLLPILLTKAIGSTNKEVYKNAYAQGRLFFKQYGKNFSVVEVGNEEDNALILSGKYDGTQPEHYNLEKANIEIAKLKGLVDGMRAVKPKVKVVVSLTWVHFYYLELLKQGGVQYDIIGYNWYSDMGDITNVSPPYGNVVKKVSLQYNKPVWITEFNLREGSLHNRNDEQVNYLKQSIEAIAREKFVQGFIIYELYDQPSFKVNNPGESEYGLLRRSAGKNVSEFKEAFLVYKNFIKKYKNYCR